MSEKKKTTTLVHLNAYSQTLTGSIGIYHSVHLTQDDLIREPEINSILEIPFGGFVISLEVAEIRYLDGYKAIYSSLNSKVKLVRLNTAHRNNRSLPEIWYCHGNGEILVLPSK